MKRHTMQRQMVLDTFTKLHHAQGHLSIEEIYHEIQKTNTSMSKTTVYRNLRQLAEADIIRQVLLPDGIERYDLRIDDHHHFTCDACEMIFDVDAHELQNMKTEIENTYGFMIHEHHLTFNGLCASCKPAAC